MIKTLLTTFTVMFLAELGDKTQLAVLSLSSTTKKPVAVFLGSMAAFAVAAGLAVALGTLGAKFLPQKAIQWAAGILFIGVGIFLIVGQIRG